MKLAPYFTGQISRVRPSLPFPLSLLRLARASCLAFAASAALHAAPGAPPWAATPAVPGNTQVALDWNTASGSVASYRVRYRTSDSTDAWTTITGLPVTPTGYTVTGLGNLKAYEFQVGATDSANATTWGTVWHSIPRGSVHPTGGLHAGGQVDAIVRAGNGIMIAGTDVGGFARSTDGGVTWRMSSSGLHITNGTRNVAALHYHAASGTVFAFCGGGGTGHLFKSNDNGQTWINVYSGTDIEVSATGKDHPRQVGRLIQVDPTNANIIYLGSHSQGVKKSTNGGTSWSQLMLANKSVNGLALDGSVLFASVDSEGVYRCTTSGGSVTFFNGTNAPTKSEEILALGGRIYVASNTQGVRRLASASSANAGASWTNLNIGSTTAFWAAIDGYIDGTNHVIVVGNTDPEQLGTSGRYTTVMKCTNAQASSGFTWVNISSATTTTVLNTTAAGNGQTYWRTDQSKGENVSADWGTEKRLDGDVFAIDQIVIDPDNHDKIHAVGQMGIWRTLNGGTSWRPAVIGLSNAVLNTITADPNNPGRIYIGDTDNALWISDDRGETMTYCTRPPGGGKPTTYTIELDPGNDEVFAGFETPLGSVRSYNRSTQTWTDVAGANGSSLGDVTAGKTVHGVRVQRISGARVILAAVADSGLWRLAAGGNWARVQTTTMTSLNGSTRKMPFAWPDSNKNLVFFYDQSTGLWRSTNAGVSWTNIWSTGYGNQYTGDLALRTSTSQLYVTNDTGLFRINNADTASNPTVTDLSVPNAARLATLGDTLWVAVRADDTGSSLVALKKSTDGTTFTTVSNTFYEGAALTPTGLAVESGYQYVTSGSMGVLISEN